MTKEQYAEYESSIADFLQRENVKPGCYSAHYDDDGNSQDPFFSWTPCRCCQRHLGGSRMDYMFARNDGSQFEAAICQDCEYYLTYGRLDDLTMLEIGKPELID